MSRFIYALSVIFGVLASGGGVYLLYSSYENYQRTLTYRGHPDITTSIWYVVWAMVVFFIAILFFLKDKYYKKMSIYILAFCVSIILSIPALLCLGYFVLGVSDPKAIDSNPYPYGLIGLLCSIAVVTLFLRIRIAGWFGKD